MYEVKKLIYLKISVIEVRPLTPLKRIKMVISIKISQSKHKINKDDNIHK